MLADLDDPLPAFYRLWTRKEAVLKANGLGIGSSLAELPKAWVRDFTPAIGYARAVAWVDSDPRISQPARSTTAQLLSDLTVRP